MRTKQLLPSDQSISVSLLLVRFIVILLVINILNNNVIAQDYNYSWRYYRPGNTGIQGDIATALWIDAEGNPYIAANTGDWGEGGLARFNLSDSSWTNYSNVDNEILGSFDNGDIQMLDIIEDQNKTLWIGTMRGALTMNPSEGISSVISFTSENSLLQGFTYDIDQSPDGKIWFTSGGLVSYNPATGDWNRWDDAASRISIQPKTDGSYIVWSTDTYYGYVISYNSATEELSYYLPDQLGQIAALPGKDCVDDEGNMWALRMSVDGNWETLEYQRPDGEWVYPTPPYDNISYYIDSFKAYGSGKALLVSSNGETWMFDGNVWNNFGTWRPYYYTNGVEADAQGNVWVCGVEGAARRDAVTGEWQRYRITNTSQIDYFVEDMTIDSQGNVWMAGNAGSGVGGFQKFDGNRWIGFNQYTYGIGYPFPYQADNTQAIAYRPSRNEVVFNPTFNGIHAWTGEEFYPLEDLLTTSGGFSEDSEGRLWSIEEYGGLRRFDDQSQQWTSYDLTGWAGSIQKDKQQTGSIWAQTDYEILRTNGESFWRRTIEDFPGSAAWLTGFAVDENDIVWTGTWSQFTSSGSTLIRLDVNTGETQTWSYDDGWPFPGEHVRPLASTPDGRIWMQFDSEYPSTDAGLLWYDGENIGIFPSAPGGIPQWGGLPNSSIKEIEVKLVEGGYELWLSCLGRGIAVLEVKDEQVDVTENDFIQRSPSLSAFPNPAEESISFSMGHVTAGNAWLQIYDLTGRPVKEIVNQSVESGDYSFQWNLKDASGKEVSPGIYLATFIHSQGKETIRLILK